MSAKRGSEPSRVFVMLITHEAFSARWARYQDGPSLCFERIRRELAADPDLQPAEDLVLARQELVDYREAHEPRTSKKKRLPSAPPDETRVEPEKP